MRPASSFPKGGGLPAWKLALAGLLSDLPSNGYGPTSTPTLLALAVPRDRLVPGGSKSPEQDWIDGLGKSTQPPGVRCAPITYQWFGRIQQPSTTTLSPFPLGCPSVQGSGSPAVATGSTVSGSESTCPGKVLNPEWIPESPTKNDSHSSNNSNPPRCLVTSEPTPERSLRTLQELEGFAVSGSSPPSGGPLRGAARVPGQSGSAPRVETSRRHSTGPGSTPS
jgi:hypothetical protein